MTVVRCPVCDAVVPWTAASHFRPFCSERCKLIDLGAWASEAYSITGNDTDESGGALPPESGSKDR